MPGPGAGKRRPGAAPRSSELPAPAEVADQVLRWFAARRRDLPWRTDRDPYAVWVSEVMLQQTRVEKAIPYFTRWMECFRDIASLAAATEAEVLKAWEGLGYYARARNMRLAAQQIVERHGGEIPADRQALLALPGIGPYTAGAILSRAYGQPEPVLDGNVQRVLCRLYDIGEDPRAAVTRKRLWQLATRIVSEAPLGRAGDLNEGLMEVGSLVCRRSAPACDACPLHALCTAHARGTETERPLRLSRRPTPHYEAGAAVIADGNGRFLIARRRSPGLLGGLWGFPGGLALPEEPLPDALKRAVGQSLGVHVEVGDPLISLAHAYSHFRITLHAYRCALVAGEPRPLGYAEVRWVGLSDLDGYPLAVTDRKIAGELRRRDATEPGRG